MGLHVDGVHWLNFLGPPVLAQLGGAAVLRSRLESAETTVLALDESRALVSLGEVPEAGGPEGKALASYRELARVLEPWLEPFLLVQGDDSDVYFSEQEARRWWQRWLD